ncbi:MAG: PIN domain-containing protein [Hormoscilla sp. GUM202]|nr:PIN domain-containing protein [Hormoscilla sp. GUM202]
MREIFDRIEAGSIVASPITLAECLVSPIRLGQNELSREYIDLILGREEIIFEYGFEESIAIQAAQFRARQNLQLLDAFQLALALAVNCDALLKNDAIFRRISEIKVVIVDDLEIYNYCCQI